MFFALTLIEIFNRQKELEVQEEQTRTRERLKSTKERLIMETAVGSLIAIIILAAALRVGIRWLVRSSSSVSRHV